MPEIKVVKGKFAAYDNVENNIIIGSSFLHPALDDDPKAQAQLFHILIEEYGHHIDYLLRNKYSDIGGDSPKDEGAMFAFLIADIAYDRQPELIFGEYTGEKGDQTLSLDFSVPFEMIAGKPRKEYIDLDGKTEDGRYEFFSAGRGKTHHGEYGHQSVEDVLDRAKFDEIDRLEVYYGNWLRDYSQVIDTKLLEMDLGTMLDGVKEVTDATTEAILKATDKARKEGVSDPEEIKKITDSVIQSRDAINKAAEMAKQNAPSSDKTLNGTLTGSKKVTQKHISRESLTRLVEVLARVEFARLFSEPDTTPYKLNTKKLGVYLPYEHLDNPLGIQATTVDPDFRGAYKASEGSIDQQRWYKSYFDDSRRYVQQQLTLAVQKGETPEGRIHFGQALHVMEDLYAHGNFIELLLLRIHKRRSLTDEPPKWVKPKVWVEETKLNNGRKIYPLVTGSFGSADTIASFLSILQKHMSKEVLFEPGVRSAGMQIMLIFLKDYDLKAYETINSNLTRMEECQKEYWPCRAVGEATHFLFSQIKEWVNGLIAYMASQVLAEMPRNQQQLPTDPTHTQLAKDHGEHPLHTLAVVCARTMVEDMGRHMKAAWGGKISINEVNKRAQAYFIHPDNIDSKSIPPLKRMVEDANLWANAAPSKIAEAASYQGDMDHAREELEALADQSSVFGKRSYQFMLWLYEKYQ